jgi:hypothetical protein
LRPYYGSVISYPVGYFFISDKTPDQGEEKMEKNFSVHIDSWNHGAAIPARFAFG